MADTSASVARLSRPGEGELRLTEGRILEIDAQGRIHVATDTADEPVAARVLSTVDVARSCHVGSRVVLGVPHSGHAVPIVLGVVTDTAPSEEQGANTPQNKEQGAKTPQSADLLLEAGDSITLRCGAGEIVVRRSGEILIKGTKVVSRSAGANKIRGATVSIN